MRTSSTHSQPPPPPPAAYPYPPYSQLAILSARSSSPSACSLPASASSPLRPSTSRLHLPLLCRILPRSAASLTALLPSPVLPPGQHSGRLYGVRPARARLIVRSRGGRHHVVSATAQAFIQFGSVAESTRMLEYCSERDATIAGKTVPLGPRYSQTAGAGHSQPVSSQRSAAASEPGTSRTCGGLPECSRLAAPQPRPLLHRRQLSHPNRNQSLPLHCCPSVSHRPHSDFPVKVGRLESSGAAAISGGGTASEGWVGW